MNRRDTVLVAVLVNVGLVVLLFVFGIKPASPIELAKNVEKKEEVLAKKEEDPATSIDQVDQILSKYIEKEEPVKIEPVALEEKKVEVVKPVEKKKVAVKDESYKEVIVKQGDMLEKIARAHKTTVEEIMRINALTSTRLQIGQILRVPANPSASTLSKAVASTSEPKYYVVKNGDNPWTIAIKNKIRVEELLRMNGLDEAKAKRLKPGDRLRIK